MRLINLRVLIALILFSVSGPLLAGPKPCAVQIVNQQADSSTAQRLISSMDTLLTKSYNLNLVPPSAMGRINFRLISAKAERDRAVGVTDYARAFYVLTDKQDRFLSADVCANKIEVCAASFVQQMASACGAEKTS